MLLLQARQLLAQRNFFVVVHRHRLFAWHPATGNLERYYWVQAT